MATVYRAEHERLGKTVALKVMDPVVAEDDEYRERFLREARAAAKLNHQNLVRALDSGCANGVYYLAMELVEGDDLRKRIEQDGKVPEHVALRVALSVAHALEEASRHGIVHRDVKPENILLAADGTVKLADLGLAKVKDEDGTLTKKGLTVGTVAYFSPEQALGQPDLDVRTDIYALGATLYAALSGELPFGRGENAPETMKRILTEPPPALAEIAPWVSPEARAVVERFMEKDRKKRPQTAREACRVLEAALKGEMPDGPGTRVSAGSSTKKSARLGSSRGSQRASRRRTVERPALRQGKLGVGLAATGIAATLAIGFGVFALRTGEERAAPSPGDAARAEDAGRRSGAAALAPRVERSPVAGERELAGALAKLLRAHVELTGGDGVVLAYDGVARALQDFEDGGTAPDAAPGETGVALRLDRDQSCRLVHKALLRAPVTIEYELALLDKAGGDSHLQTLLADPRGQSVVVPGHGKLSEWQAGWPLEPPGAPGATFRLSHKTTHQVRIVYDSRLAGSVDGASWSAPLPAGGPVRLAIEATGNLSTELRHLKLTGQIDRAWLDRATPGAPPAAPEVGEAPR